MSQVLSLQTVSDLDAAAAGALSSLISIACCNEKKVAL
jgi:hypothetical protein